MEIYNVQGMIVHHSMYSKPYCNNEEVNYLCQFDPYDFSDFDNRNTKSNGIKVSNIYNLDDGSLCLSCRYVYVTSYRQANKKEIEEYKNILKKHNLSYETRNLVSYNYSIHSGFYKREFELTTTFYLSKEDFQIRIGDKITTYGELKRNGIDDKYNVILSGDNGYSHVWAKSQELSSVFSFIDSIFDSPTQYDTEFHGYGKSITGDKFGWDFGTYGELILKLTKHNIDYSQVSNT